MANLTPDTPKPQIKQLHRKTALTYVWSPEPTGLSTDTVAAVLKAAAETARKQCASVPARVHCHTLRKTKAMDLYQNGIPLPIIMRILGHENASTTQAFYAFATVDMIRDAINTATPTTSPPAAQKLPEDTLQARYSLR